MPEAITQLFQEAKMPKKMNHAEWIREQFPAICRSLGFILTPREEIEARHKRLRQKMESVGMEALLVLQKMDYFYLSGTAQDALLFVPLDGKPLLIVKRELERARIESPLEHVVGLKSLRDLPALVAEHAGRLPGVLGLEMDILPARDYLRLQSIFSSSKLVDGSGILRDLRKIKSPFEVDLMRKAGDIAKRVYQEAGKILREEMTEIEFGGLLEAVAKTLGHEGLLRVRSFNYEAYSWHVLSGYSGGVVSQSDSPMGGLGLSPAFPVGASRKTMKVCEPILVDFGICRHGYQTDETRMFSIGKMPQKFVDAYNACREIHDAVLSETRPGADCEGLFLKTLDLARALGYEDSYLGPPGLQTKFIAHGIGLELNEYPFIAQGQPYSLEEGMTFALEPKIVFPGEGSVGLENTVVVTAEGYEILTPIDMEIVEV
jgi:Xaa-Pro dipeptidase